MRKKLQVHIKINKLLKSRHNLSAEEKTKVVDTKEDIHWKGAAYHSLVIRIKQIKICMFLADSLLRKIIHKS